MACGADGDLGLVRLVDIPPKCPLKLGCKVFLSLRHNSVDVHHADVHRAAKSVWWLDSRGIFLGESDQGLAEVAVPSLVAANIAEAAIVTVEWQQSKEKTESMRVGLIQVDRCVLTLNAPKYTWFFSYRSQH